MVTPTVTTIENYIDFKEKNPPIFNRNATLCVSFGVFTKHQCHSKPIEGRHL